MTFLERMSSHLGNLILLKEDLYWNERHDLPLTDTGWDNIRGRVCLILTAEPVEAGVSDVEAQTDKGYFRALTPSRWVKARLLIDGIPRVVVVHEETIILLDPDSSLEENLNNRNESYAEG